MDKEIKYQAYRQVVILNKTYKIVHQYYIKQLGKIYIWFTVTIVKIHIYGGGKLLRSVT